LKEDKKKERGEVSRRDFLVGAGAVVVGGAIGAGITYPLVSGDGGGTTTVETTKTVSVAGPTVTSTTTMGTGDVVTTTVDGGTKTVTTIVDGGGAVPPALEPEVSSTQYLDYGVVTDVDVKNGKIVRTRPTHYDWKYPELQPLTITGRDGKTMVWPLKSAPSPYNLAYRKRTDSPNRILYPLQRVDWDPNGERNPQNRSVSKYKRISWDEAATIIASELKRMGDTYGPEAISNMSSIGHTEGHNVGGSHDTQFQFMNYWALSEYGASITGYQFRMTSYAGGVTGARYVWGYYSYETSLWWQDVAENTDMLVGWGSDTMTKDWIWAPGQMRSKLHLWYKELGIKQVYINPDLNKGAAVHANKWIPIMPNTDAAMMLAVAYTWISEDTYETEYVDTHTVGFDKWKDYVMGVEDGIPKTPEWASPLCGVPEWTIKALAHAWANNVTSTTHGMSGGGASCRSIYAHEAMRMEIYLLAMQGWGAPGKHYGLGFTAPSAARPPSTGGVGANAKIAAAMGAELGVRLSGLDRDRQFISIDDIYDCFYNAPVSWWNYDDPFYKRTYPMEGKSEVHMIWCTAMPYSGSLSDGHRALKALRSPKMECIVSQNMFMEDAMVFSDIILPIATIHESYDIPNIYASDVCGSLILKKQAVKPAGEAKSDFAAVCEVAKKLNFLDKLTGGKEAEEIEAERVKEGYENSGLADLVTWEELNEKNHFSMSFAPSWTPPSLAFFNDPDANPLPTPSGKLEFESTLLKENFPDDKERPPVAHYVRGGPASEGWTHNEDRLISERAQDYPLLVVANTPYYRHHSMRSDIPWTRELDKVIGWDGYAYSPVWISPVDAAARGIADGDIVNVFNERGGVLGGAVVNERIIPGALCMQKAGGYDNIIPTELNRGGNVNCISPTAGHSLHAYGQAPSGYLAEVERVTGNQMDEWRKNYPESFARDYDPAYGPLFSGWVEGGK